MKLILFIRRLAAATASLPDKFTGADPFLFLLTSVIIFLFGPGALSLDHLIDKKWRAEPAQPLTPRG